MKFLLGCIIIGVVMEIARVLFRFLWLKYDYSYNFIKKCHSDYCE